MTEKSKPINLPMTKSGNKVKIGLPSLCDYDDDDEEEEESVQPIKQAPAKTGEEKKPGLLGLLPPPKANAFIKKETSNESNRTETTPPVSLSKSFGLLLPRTLKKPISEVEESDEKNSKKFKQDEPKIKSAQSFREIEEVSKFAVEEDPALQFNDEDEEEEEEAEENPDVSEDHIEQPKKPVLDSEAWKRFCGGKRNKEPIEIKDVNANEILGDPQVNLMKQITGDYQPPSNRDFFAGSSRKKHQITYLAYVAKERDQELKNAWAQSKFNRMQAKAKYGF